MRRCFGCVKHRNEVSLFFRDSRYLKQLCPSGQKLVLWQRLVMAAAKGIDKAALRAGEGADHQLVFLRNLRV
jgi:hypothetical protein